MQEHDVTKLTGGSLKGLKILRTFYPNPFFQTATKKEMMKENEL